jgi:predicted nuclease of predicted toxin-antitoxin system
MARSHVDQCLSWRVADGLRGLGHDARHASEIGMHAADDDEHLIAAARDRRIIVTENEDDFALLHDAWIRWQREWNVPTHWRHAGILIVPSDYDVQTVMTHVHAFVSEQHDFTDALVVRTARGWQWRSPP